MNVRIVPDRAGLAAMAADMAVSDLQAAIDIHGQVTWVIAGGTAPVEAYKLLGGRTDGGTDWSKVTIVIGDERCVPFDSPESNWSQAEAALLRHIKTSDYTARPQSDLPAEAAADKYEEYLRGLPLALAGLPRFDVAWLGVGEDGHTLSLFPDHPSSDDSERLVIPVHDSPKPPPDRISLTFRALGGVSRCVILAAGAGKTAVVGRAIAGDMTLPIARAAATIEQAGGSVTWLLDTAAAGDTVKPT